MNKIPFPVIVALNFVLWFHKPCWVCAIFEITDCDAEEFKMLYHVPFNQVALLRVCVAYWE